MIDKLGNFKRTERRDRGSDHSPLLHCSFRNQEALFVRLGLNLGPEWFVTRPSLSTSPRPGNLPLEADPDGVRAWNECSKLARAKRS